MSSMPLPESEQHITQPARRHIWMGQHPRIRATPTVAMMRAARGRRVLHRGCMPVPTRCCRHPRTVLVLSPERRPSTGGWPAPEGQYSESVQSRMERAEQ